MDFDTFDFPLHGWLENEDWGSLQRVSALFAAAYGGAFLGCIGALDGLLAVKIRCPTLSDLISDPGNYYCLKGFYALNVQAASGGAFLGCIGALDGLAVKIRCPTLSYLISDPGNYYCL
jgi:uncharacterized membrane protein YkgB